MKTLKIIVLAIGIFLGSNAQAQLSVNVNIGTRPDWAPAAPVEVNYYYLPDVDSYYDVRESQYIYYGGGRWIHSRTLPVRYRNYDPYHGRTIVLTDYHGKTPYVLHKSHKTKYYVASPRKVVVVKEKGHGNGHGNGKGKGHGKH
ncbi:MAG: hypothetical protein PSV16_06860 [Flavobacterium sp.]|nr:hypothetical protein [Flavobacterium sp.]